MPAIALAVGMPFGRVDSGDSQAPTQLSATINAAGTTLTLVFSEAVKIGAGGSGGLMLASGEPVTATYASGGGTPILIYNFSRVVADFETPTEIYTQPGNGLEDAAGNDLASFGPVAVTNSSTKTFVDLATPDAAFWASNAPGHAANNTASDWNDVTNTKTMTSADQAVYLASVAAFNNRPAFKGNGSSSFLQWARGSDLTGDWSVILVGAFEDLAASYKQLCGDKNGGHMLPWLTLDSSLYEASYIGGTTNGRNYDAKVHMWVIVNAGASSKNGRDGAFQIMGNAGTDPFTGFSLFRYGPSAAFFSAGHVAFAAAYSGDITAHAQFRNIQRGIATYYRLPAITGTHIFCDGDSRDAGCGDFGTGNRWGSANFFGGGVPVQPNKQAELLAQAAFTDPVATASSAVGGRSTHQQNDDAVVRVAPSIALSTAAKKVAVFYNAGINAMIVDGESPAVAAGRVTTWVNARIADGCNYILLGTSPTFVGISGPLAADLVTLNNLIRAMASSTIIIDDWAADPAFDPNVTPGNFQADGTHLNLAGHVAKQARYEAALAAAPILVT